MQPAKINYKIYQGSTFQETFRWESETKVYVPIQTIAKAAPCVITTSANHNLPQGWRFRVVGAGGMKEINSQGDSYYLATSVTPTTIEINHGGNRSSSARCHHNFIISSNCIGFWYQKGYKGLETV